MLPQLLNKEQWKPEVRSGRYFHSSYLGGSPPGSLARKRKLEKCNHKQVLHPTRPACTFMPSICPPLLLAVP